MRLARTAILVLFGAGCGGRIEGTAAAPAGTVVLIYRTDDADEYEAAVLQHNSPLGRAFALSFSSADSGAQALGIVDSVLRAPPRGDRRNIAALGRGTVGVGGSLAIDGNYRGRVALVIEEAGRPSGGCRVDVAMPIYGGRVVTMAGPQCKVWPQPTDPEQLRREIATKWSEDSLAHAATVRRGSVLRANAAAMLNWPWVADRDGMYYFAARSPCALKIPAGRRTYLRDPAYAHANGYGRSPEPGC